MTHGIWFKSKFDETPRFSTIYHLVTETTGVYYDFVKKRWILLVALFEHKNRSSLELTPKAKIKHFIYDISFFFYCWKINGILSFLFLLSRQINPLFKQCFSLELYTFSLNISQTWFIMGSSWFLLLLQSPNKAVCGISASTIKLFSKGKSQMYIQ